MVKTAVKNSIEQFRRNNGLAYILSIGSTSGFSIFKGFLLAIFLSPSIYGQYASLYAICIFMGTMLSFGNIESTIKTYPRCHLDGQHKEILADTFVIIRILTFRCLITLPIVAFTVWYLTGTLDAVTIIGSSILTLTTAVFNIIASGIRATGLLIYIGRIQFVRSIISFIIVLLIAKLFKYVPYLFIAEALASTISIILSVFTLSKSLDLQREKLVIPSKGSLPISAFKEGLPLFFSNALISIPAFFDKSIIGSSIGFALAGAYGLLSVINQAGTLISNIMAQKVGPQIIKIAKQAKNIRSVIVYFIKWISIFCFIQFVIVIGVLIVYNIPYFHALFAKYNIQNSSIFLMGAISIMQAKSFMDFFFIAYDKEKIIFWNALQYIVLFVVFFAFVIVMKMDFNSFLWAILAAKFIQMLLFVFDYIKLTKGMALTHKEI
ncbi:hypothetical protein DBR11_20025 [Pedobacter sp. HMWF019]|uniref:oligosaccharide flippase family protein n=1 Tax=Pedobacter sp. HMWF019 TaxID=2056856 RepID=UPI000D39DB14|nr:oligosaccharide flippase family protein [Pedobacter sp. HMWF019]PTS95972.1 hypothetical protein DBR11_20025 [Pedobacter sp. HMWF019]